MRTDQLAKIALTVAMISLVGNYLQFMRTRAQGQRHDVEISRLHIEHRKESMLERATAFYELVLGMRQGMPVSERSWMEQGEYRIEYAVQVPERQRQEFEQWMSGAKPPQFAVPARSYRHESAARRVQSDGREVEELFEKFAIAVP
jgi:catechol-2,3-dioxygenase